MLSYGANVAPCGPWRIHRKTLRTRERRPPSLVAVDCFNGRGERIRTSDLSVPNRAHYQAVLRPELIFTLRKGSAHSMKRFHLRSSLAQGSALVVVALS